MLRNPLRPAALWLLLVTAALLMPHIPAPPGGIVGLDKGVHFVLFLVLALLWKRAWGARPGASRRVLAAGLAYGALTEALQYLLPIGRSAELLDLLADAAGLLAGLAAAAAWRPPAPAQP